MSEYLRNKYSTDLGADPKGFYEKSYGLDFGQKSAPSASMASAGGGQSMVSEGAQGAAMGGPAGAAMAVGGSFLSNYLAQKAADERAKRDRAAQIEQNYAQNQNQGFDTMMRTAQGALR